MAFCVYVLLNPEGKTYVGQTCELERRLAQHNDPPSRLTLHTKRHAGPWRVVQAYRIKYIRDRYSGGGWSE